jgi:hypothetical protein
MAKHESRALELEATGNAEIPLRRGQVAQPKYPLEHSALGRELRVLVRLRFVIAKKRVGVA